MSDVVTINLGLILLIASVVAMISRRMRLPYSVGLVAAGFAGTGTTHRLRCFAVP